MTLSSIPSPADTIAARATPPGAGAVAIVRLSGPRAIEIAAALFHPAAGGSLAEAPDRTLTLGTLREAPGPEAPALDECLAAVWRAPHSYTGENAAELHLHGGAHLARRALEALLRAGARAAQPGEFTRRAFLNGRLDLAQAEAVADLVAAQTAAAARLALGQLGGALSKRVGEMRAALLRLTAETEAMIDFPEEDLPAADRARQGRTLDTLLAALNTLLADARRGRPLREGARVAFAGRPNAGKSSLFNALLGRERAIVAPHEGTTRDIIEAEVDLDGIPTTLVDMAGLRETPGEIEAIGVARAREEIQSSDLVVFLLDLSRPLCEADDAAFRALRERPHLIVVNKTDLPPPCFSGEDVERRFSAPATRGRLWLSAKTREGLAGLERALAAILRGEAAEDAGGGGQERETPLVASARHIHALETAREHLLRAQEGVSGRLPPELVASDLRAALSHLSQITGQADLAEDVLDSIFSTFCIGK